MGKGGGDAAQSTGSLPFWAEGASRNLIANAENEAYNTPYEAYGGPRIAGLTPQEQQANIAREEMFNRGDVAGQFAADQYTKSAGMTDQVWGVANSEFDDAEYQKRRNPYYNAVVQRTLREADESFNRRLNQDQASSVARGGSIGSYRVGLENAFLEGERAESLGDIRNQGELDAYNQALGSFESDRTSKLTGLGQASDQYNAIGQGANVLGTDSLAREQSMTNELDRSGAIAREMRQKELNLGYQDYEDEKNWGWTQMERLNAIMAGVPYSQLQQTTFDPGQASNISQLIGLGVGAASIQQMWGGGE